MFQAIFWGAVLRFSQAFIQSTSTILIGLVTVAVGAWAAAEGIRYTLSETFRGLHDIRLAALLGDPCRSVLLAAAFIVLGVTTHKLVVENTELTEAIHDHLLTNSAS